MNRAVQHQITRMGMGPLSHECAAQDAVWYFVCNICDDGSDGTFEEIQETFPPASTIAFLKSSGITASIYMTSQ